MEKEMSRSGAHIKIIQQIFREEGIPEELAVIPQVFKQLGGNTRILWGISPGKTYGLRLNAYINENSSFEKATRAAAQYLCDLYKIHGNWELALAAFYSGENNLNQAIKKAGTRKFWIVYNRLDRETRNFVPSVYAAVMIARNPAKYGFDHVEIAAPIQYDSVRIPANTDLSLLAPALGTSLGDLRNLNPEYRNNFSPPEPYILRVPPGTGQAVLNFLKEPYKTQ